MTYVGGEAKEAGCVFCNRLRADQDVASLILYRAQHAFVIMNLFPYNTGHVMLVPNEHVDSPERASPEALAEMATLLPSLLKASRRVLDCHGFNIGINVGSIAGAGVAEHLHQHLVPRWNGDANFMPILGSAMVIPELIPVTYAKLRAEFERVLGSAVSASAVLVDEARERFGRFADEWQPTVTLAPSQSVARSLLDRFPGSSLAGWAGEAWAIGSGPIVLTISVPDSVPGITWTVRDRALAQMEPDQRRRAECALENLAPTFVLSEP